MKELTSVLEGLQVILGTARINLAAFLTILITIRRPPTYTEGDTINPDYSADDLNRNAKITYWGLLFMHFIQAIFLWNQSHNYKTDYKWNLNTTRSFVVFFFIFMYNLVVWYWKFGNRAYYIKLYSQGYELKSELNLETWSFDQWVSIESALMV